MYCMPFIHAGIDWMGIVCICPIHWTQTKTTATFHTSKMEGRLYILLDFRFHCPFVVGHVAKSCQQHQEDEQLCLDWQQMLDRSWRHRPTRHRARLSPVLRLQQSKLPWRRQRWMQRHWRPTCKRRLIIHPLPALTPVCYA